MARPVLRAKKQVPDAGSLSDVVVPLNSGWDTSFGSATYSPADGDFILVSRSIGVEIDTSPTITAPSGTYTTISDQYQNDASDIDFLVAYKFAVAATDTSVTLSATGAAGREGTYDFQIWSGVDPADPFSSLIAEAGNINGGRPDPPAVTPDTPDSVVIVIGGAAVLSGMTPFVQGGDLSNFLSIAQTGGNEAAIGSGSFDWTSGTFNPAAWTGGSTGTGACWCSTTFALKPAPAGGGGEYIYKGAGNRASHYKGARANDTGHYLGVKDGIYAS